VALKRMTNPNGTKANPVSSAEKCSMRWTYRLSEKKRVAKPT
jgi:hypothetical protein